MTKLCRLFPDFGQTNSNHDEDISPESPNMVRRHPPLEGLIEIKESLID